MEAVNEKRKKKKREIINKKKTEVKRKDKF